MALKAKKEEKKRPSTLDPKTTRAAAAPPPPLKSNVPAVKQGGGAVVSAEEMAKWSGAGMETMGREDFAIPFLTILQALSPQLQKNKSEYNPEAEQGMIMNTATGELFSGEDGILVIPVAYDFEFIEWRPRDIGGGLVARYKRGEQPTDVKRNDKGQDVRAANGNILVGTHQYFVLVDNDGKIEQCVLAMSKTQAKKSKRWNGLLNQAKVPGTDRQAPAFANVWRFTTIAESNDKGSWYGWNYELVGQTPRPIFMACVQFLEAIKAGSVKVAEPAAEDVGGVDGEETGAEPF